MTSQYGATLHPPRADGLAEEDRGVPLRVLVPAPLRREEQPQRADKRLGRGEQPTPLVAGVARLLLGAI